MVIHARRGARSADMDRGRQGISRRALLSGGAATGVGALVAGCGAGSSAGSGGGRATSAALPAHAEIDVLNSVLDLEHMAVAAYTRAAGRLHGGSRRLAEHLLSQESAHVTALEHMISHLGGAPDAARDTYRFARRSSPARVLEALHHLEAEIIASYIDAIPKLSIGRLRARAAAIATDEAEHSMLLARAQGRPLTDQLPQALVTGAAHRT